MPKGWNPFIYELRLITGFLGCCFHVLLFVLCKAYMKSRRISFVMLLYVVQHNLYNEYI